MSTSLTIAYQGRPAGSGQEEVWLRMEQDAVDDGLATFADLERMLAMVRGGLTARAWQPASCQVTVTPAGITVPVAFVVYPSDLALAYSLSPGFGVISAATLVREWHEFDLVVPMADSVALPFLAEQVSAAWQTPCYNEFGEVIAAPAMTVLAAGIEFGATVFGVLRMRCLAVGYRHTLTMEFGRTEGQAIRDVRNRVVAAYQDNTGETRQEELDIELPGCAEDLLETCPDGTLIAGIGFQVIDGSEETIPTVYYSECTGRVLAVRYEPR